MEFLKMKKFIRKSQKPENATTTLSQQQQEQEPNQQNVNNDMGKSSNASTNTTTSREEEEDEDDDDDDDFIMNEVKRRLKELRRNSFMVLIPEEQEQEDEETCPEEEQEQDDHVNDNEWRDVEAESRHLWSCFGPFYDKYCERMLFFDRLTTNLLKDISVSQSDHSSSTPSPRSVSKKLTSPLRCLSLKKFEHPPQDDTEQLQQHQPENDPYLDLETSYVSQLCLTWEALHCQYTQLTTTASQSENSKCYNHSAQQFQQFQVLLQRFIENEPFERGLRPEIFAHTRNTFSKLLQVPNILGQDRKAMTEEESFVEAPDLIRIIESSILTFQVFVKMDKKKKSNGVRNIFGNQNQMVTPLQQVQSLLDKRKMKLKELWKKRKGGKKNQWPATQEDVELLLALIDVKVISRVLRMVKITKEQLFWTEEKMKKLHVSAATGKLQRDPSPILFPC